MAVCLSDELTVLGKLGNGIEGGRHQEDASESLEALFDPAGGVEAGAAKNSLGGDPVEVVLLRFGQMLGGFGDAPGGFGEG